MKTISVREWFRMARKSFWESGDLAPTRIDKIAQLIAFHHSTPPLDYIGGFVWVAVPEEAVSRDVAIAEAEDEYVRLLKLIQLNSNDQFRRSVLPGSWLL